MINSPEYLSRLTKKMAAILGGQYNDKEPIFLDDSIRIRTKKKYMNYCLFILRLLAILVTLSLIMACCISLYRYNKGLKRTFIVVEPGCASCDFLNPTASSLKGEIEASTETTIQEIVTTDNYFDEGNVVSRKDVITETRNETQSINLSGHAEVQSENPNPSLLTPPSTATPPPPPSGTPSPPPPPPPGTLPPPPTNDTPPPPPTPATPSSSPMKEKERQPDYLNENTEYEYQNDVEVEQKPKSGSSGSAYEIVMGYVRPVRDFVIGLINRFLSYFSG